MKYSALLSILLVGVISGTCFAEKNAKLKPALGATGDVVLKDAFAGEELGKRWKVNKGTFKIVDGVVSGSELPADKHAAVLTCTVPNRNSAIQFSFKLGDAKAFHLSFNKKRGHLFRVMITPKNIVLRTDKPGKRSKIKPVVLARASKPLSTKEWHTMLVEVRGTKVAVQLDNGVTLKGSHPSLDVDKPNYRFIVRGKTLSLDDLTIWKANP